MDLSQRAVPVSVKAGEWQLAGDLYLPPGPQPDTVQLLLAGLTYDRRYWLVPGSCHYVRHMLADGHAVLALDRIGTGASDHPPAIEVTVQANVDSIHEVVAALRAGIHGAEPFARVVAVGHSLGSGIAIINAAQYQDFDALVLTSLTHTLGPLYPTAVGSLQPAGPSLPDGYLTTEPGKRAAVYEHTGNVSALVNEYHEQSKSTVTAGEGATVDEIYRLDHAAAVTVPVLLVHGQEDGLFVAPEDEQAHFSGAPEFDTFIVPSAAHSLNVHRTAHLWYSAASRWLAKLSEPAPRI